MHAVTFGCLDQPNTLKNMLIHYVQCNLAKELPSRVSVLVPVTWKPA